MRLELGHDLGPVLTGRIPGESLRGLIESALRSDLEVVLDFKGVEAISPSFADEVFSKLPVGAIETGVVRLENIDDRLATIVAFFAPREAAAG